jgi:hypothetical protein
MNPKNLHRLIGTTLVQFHNPPMTFVILDRECGGNQRVALFTTTRKSRTTNYCWPDACIVKNGEVKATIEIEQTGEPSPAKLASKILPAALSNFLICRDKPNEALPMSAKTTFIQIVNSSSLRTHTSKRAQYANFESNIRELLPLRNISKYFLLVGNAESFVDDAQDHVSFVNVLRESLDN